jgi:hypothetical protein
MTAKEASFYEARIELLEDQMESLQRIIATIMDHLKKKDPDFEIW